MLLHFGFEPPTPEIMAAWGQWFESVADKTVDQGSHFVGGREISHSGTKDLPLGADSITGYTVINAESLDDAEKIAQDNPFIASIRVCELMTMLVRTPETHGKRPATSEKRGDGYAAGAHAASAKRASLDGFRRLC